MTLLKNKCHRNRNKSNVETALTFLLLLDKQPKNNFREATVIDNQTQQNFYVLTQFFFVKKMPGMGSAKPNKLKNTLE
jgi:uncharacterized protein (DUF924 family)